MSESCASAGNGEGAGGGGKTILFAWELGAGLGHLMQMLPLAEDFARAGHCVVVALRHLERAASVFGKAGVFYLQAPYRSPHAAPARRPAGFAQLLSNLGFGDDDELFALASAWRNLIRSVGPDLIVCDYSPTALLAARAFPEVKRAVIGSGFCVPPDVEGEVWGPIRPGAIATDPTAARVVEAEVLTRVNWVLENWGEPPLARLGQLYGDVDETFLTTFPELDHFGLRAGAGYWGPTVAPSSGEAPKWPDTKGKRVFAYLKATSVAGEVLRALKDLKLPTVAYVDGLSAAAARKRLASPTLHLAEGRVDVARAGRECDLAVLNGGHGVTAEMLLAGKPVLAVPLVLEQHHTGAALRRLSAGDVSPSTGGEPWDWAGRGKLEAVASDEGYAEAARAFAGRYAGFDPAAQREAMVRRAGELMSDGVDLRLPIAPEQCLHS